MVKRSSKGTQTESEYFYWTLENKPLTIDLVTWLGLSFDSDSELTRQMDLLNCKGLLLTTKQYI